MPSARPDQQLEVEAHSHTLPQPLTASDISVTSQSHPPRVRSVRMRYPHVRCIAIYRSDISKIEQVSFSVRTDVYEISEDFVDVLPCDEGLTFEALLKYVKDIMVRCSMGATEMIGIVIWILFLHLS